VPQHQTQPTTILAGVLALTLALAGCGKSSPGSTSKAPTTSVATASTNTTPTTASTPTPQEAPILEIPLRSSVKVEPISSRYTCDGADISPPITWTMIPPHTAELDLFVFTQGGTAATRLANWAVAGLKPSLRGLSAGKLPPGAIVGRNGYGQTRYSVCPPKGTRARYLIHLFALPRSVPVKPGFEPRSLEQSFLTMPLPEGLLRFTYKRG